VREVGELLFAGLLGTGEVAGRYRAAAAEAALRGEGLRVRWKPAIGRLNRWSAVCGEAIDGGLGVVGGGQTVAAGGFGPGVSHELGDQDEVVAVADEPGAEGVAQYGVPGPRSPVSRGGWSRPDGNGRGRWSRPASIRSLIVTRPIVPAAFRKLDAIAVLTGPLLPAPRLQRAEDVGEPEPDEADVPLLQRAQHEFFLPIHGYHPRRPCFRAVTAPRIQQASTAWTRCASAISFWAVAAGMVFPDWACTSLTKSPSVPQASVTSPDASSD
jgi:hypothetical protein